MGTVIVVPDGLRLPDPRLPGLTHAGLARLQADLERVAAAQAVEVVPMDLDVVETTGPVTRVGVYTASTDRDSVVAYAATQLGLRPADATDAFLEDGFGWCVIFESSALS